MAIHVLQLGPYPPPVGGISRNILAIREELLAAGNECTIIATSRSSTISDEPGVYHPGSAAALLRLLRSLKFDVLHLHIGGEIGTRVLALAAACAYFGRGRSVLTLHSGAYPQTSEAIAATPNSIRGRIFRGFSKIVAVNEQLADVFRRFGVDAERISVIPPYSLRPPDDSVTVPPELSGFIERHSPLLLAVGGLEKDYDPLLQIAALQKVREHLPEAGLMIVGDGSMRAEVEAAVSACGYGDSIFIAGNIDHAITLHLISDADILLRTTLFDGDAISVREALFLGTPVIATDDGMRPDGVHLTATGDTHELVRKIIEISRSEPPPLEPQTADNSNITSIIDIYHTLA